MEVVKDIFVPMRDGVRLAIDIYRPALSGSYPVILTRTPYIKDGTTGVSLGAMGRPRVSAVGPLPLAGARSRIAGVEPFVEAGYVVVVSDTRGTGYSEGVYDYYNLQGGPYDGYDTIEWIASQPWCDGNVGIMGASAGAVLAYAAALTQPPHLKAMVANMHPADFYFDQWFVGGVFRYENRISWCVNQLQRIVPLDPGVPSEPGYESKLQVYRNRYHQYYERIAAGKNAMNLDWLTEMLQHRTYDEFWKKRSFVSRLNEIGIPTLHGGVLFDHFSRGTLTSHQGIDVPNRLFLAPGGLDTDGLAGDGGFVRLQVRWFDHFLKGTDNGVLIEPAARLYLTGEERWIDEPAWPVPALETPFFLCAGPGGGAVSLNDGLLRAEPEDLSEPDAITHDPDAPNMTADSPSDQRSFEIGCLTYSTAPLARDLKVIGMPRLRLFASSDARDVDWCVRLCDVFPDGRSRLLNTGALKGRHVFSHEQPADLEPNRVYEFDIEIWAVVNVFKVGHRIRIDVSTSDFPFFETNPLPSRSLVLHTKGYPSRLILPVNEG